MWHNWWNLSYNNEENFLEKEDMLGTSIFFFSQNAFKSLKLKLVIMWHMVKARPHKTLLEQVKFL